MNIGMNLGRLRRLAWAPVSGSPKTLDESAASLFARSPPTGLAEAGWAESMMATLAVSKVKISDLKVFTGSFRWLSKHGSLAQPAF
ncbi:MAG: hypothetical protein KDB52_09975 [Solirubrobacterales bacterium]|nr:hypothetical protein [Solirubrobacterales bacterium]